MSLDEPVELSPEEAVNLEIRLLQHRVAQSERQLKAADVLASRVEHFLLSRVGLSRTVQDLGAEDLLAKGLSQWRKNR